MYCAAAIAPSATRPATSRGSSIDDGIDGGRCRRSSSRAGSDWLSRSHGVSAPIHTRYEEREPQSHKPTLAASKVRGDESALGGRPLSIEIEVAGRTRDRFVARL